jgi:hypothetical protein
MEETILCYRNSTLKRLTDTRKIWKLDVSKRILDQKATENYIKFMVIKMKI